MLEQVQDTLTVDAIMTGRKELVTLASSDESSEVQEAARELQINQVPVLDEGDVVGLMIADPRDRALPEDGSYEPIAPKWLVSADTSIRKLVDILDDERHPARFVFQENEVVGLVTYADLNDAVARTALYLLISQLEIKLARLIRMGEEDIWTYIQILDEERQERLDDLQDEMEEEDVVHDLVEHFTLSDVVNIVRDEPSLLEKTEIPSRDHFNGLISGVKELRHDVAHSVRLVIKSVGSVGEVNHACDSIERLLGMIPSHPPQHAP
jgi:CBS domain-containing protein